MRKPGFSIRRRRIVVGWPLALTLMAAWILPLAGFIHLARQHVALVALVREQQNQIETGRREIEALRDRLRVLEAIEDLQSQLAPDEAAALARHVYDIGRHLHLDPLLLVAMIDVESNFGADRISIMGARGLMQLKPSTGRAVAERLGVEWSGDDGLFDPAYNLKLAAVYLSELIDEFGTVERALVAYNRGENVVRASEATGDPLPKVYVQRVLTVYHWLRYRHALPALPPLAEIPSL